MVKVAGYAPVTESLPTHLGCCRSSVGLGDQAAHLTRGSGASPREGRVAAQRSNWYSISAKATCCRWDVSDELTSLFANHRGALEANDVTLYI
jgi:hypothetical protein